MCRLVCSVSSAVTWPMASVPPLDVISNHPRFDNGVSLACGTRGGELVRLLRDILALQAWPGNQVEGHEFVFCSVGKGGLIGAGKLITGTDVYRVVKATEEKSGVAFRLHDLCRTFITEALTTGTPLADVQAQAGHSQASTTLLYAQPMNAKERLARMRLRYG